MNFLNISDLPKEDINKILFSNNNINNLISKNIGLIFENYSTRTRLSFLVCISDLGGNAIDIKFSELNMSRDESFEDTFRAFNCYLDGLIYRTNDHQKLIKSSVFFQKPIINALSDLSHPCQILGDLYTIHEALGSLDVNILWIGDCNNVLYSLVEACNLFDQISLTICSPKEIIKGINFEMSPNIVINSDLNDIDLKKINCVMTDVFVSMNEKDSEEKVSYLKDYSVTSDIMSKTSSNSIFMHCLPAKVGHEVSEEVFRGPKSIVWKQAYNRMVAQKKLLQFIYQ